MPLSSPTKPTSKAAHTAKQQAQIVSLTAQRDELLQQYKAALQSQSSPKSITKPSAFVALDVPPASTTTASTVPDTAATSGQDTPPALVQGGMTREETEELMKHATGTLKRHIRLLHEYNEIKDVATGLVGLVAEQRGEKVGVVMEEMGVGEGD